MGRLKEPTHSVWGSFRRRFAQPLGTAESAQILRISNLLALRTLQIAGVALKVRSLQGVARIPRQCEHGGQP